METSFEKAWKRLEQTPRPSRARNVLVRDWGGFKDAVERGSDYFADRLCASLYAGDCYILRGAFSRSFMLSLKKKALEFFRSEPSSFHKMTENPLTPDFHKIITEEEGRKYSFPICKHAAYYFPWNQDPIWEPIWGRWRVVKKLMGLKEDEYERNTPKDGVIDRPRVERRGNVVPGPDHEHRQQM